PYMKKPGEAPAIPQAPRPQESIAPTPTGEAPVAPQPAAVPKQSEDLAHTARQMRTEKGRNVVNEADTPGQLPAVIEEKMREIGELKAALDTMTSTFEDFQKRLWSKLEAEGKVSPADTEVG